MKFIDRIIIGGTKAIGLALGVLLITLKEETFWILVGLGVLICREIMIDWIGELPE